MEERIVTREVGRSTWQGPESEAPDEPLPIDMPPVEDHQYPTPLQSVTRSDLVLIAIGLICAFMGGALAMWVLV